MVKSSLERGCSKWLEETAQAVVSKTKENTAVSSGRTREGWSCILNREEGFAVIGNPLENTVWEEFGTGEYALSGDGRKNGWVYRNDDGEFRFTYGKQPGRPMMRGYLQLRESSVQSAESIFKEVMK
jgi:hypothetical protein